MSDSEGHRPKRNEYNSRASHSANALLGVVDSRRRGLSSTKTLTFKRPSFSVIVAINKNIYMFISDTIYNYSSDDIIVILHDRLMYTERQKKLITFLERYLLKSTASKWMIFGLMLATVLLITHVQKQRNRICQKLDKCPQITASPISKSQKLLPFHRTDFRTFQYSYSFKFNSGIRNQLQQTYCEHDYVPRYWIWMNSYRSVRKSARWKGSSFCDKKKGLVVIWRHLSNVWHFRFLCFLTWVMRRTVANIIQKNHSFWCGRF